MTLEQEIGRLSKQLNDMRKQSKVLKEDITQFLKSRNENGVKLNDHAFIIEDKQRLVSIKPTEKKEVLIELLRANGVSDPMKFIKDFNELSHVEKDSVKLKIKKS